MLSSQVCPGHHHETHSCAHNELASCCNEAFKIATSSAAYLNNYFMYIGTEGVYSHTFEHEKRADCPVCVGGSLEIKITIPQDGTVRRVIELLEEKQCVTRLPYSKDQVIFSVLCSQISKPSLSTPTSQIYFQAPPQLEAATRPNLEKMVSEFVPEGGVVLVTSTSRSMSVSLCITYDTSL